jgi:predicted ATPase/class 3 adenylate cyclase
MVVCPACGAEIPDEAGECPGCGTIPGQHKLVTIVFCDVVNSSRLTDELGPAGTRILLNRFQDLAQEVLQARHGGNVGHLRGDGMMTVFGIPVMHDDDAVRAVRAAEEFRQALVPLSRDVEEQYHLPFRVRLGINSGSALVSGGNAIEEQVTSTAANFAKRLEEAAEPGGILLGVDTYKLVKDAVQVEEVQLQVDDGTQLLPAYRVVNVLPNRPGRIRWVEGPLIGRGLEQRMLHSMFERTLAESSCHLVAALGPPGVGKSRLIEEFARQVGQRATILRGHCLSYGDSVAFWPIVEIVHSAAGIQSTDSADQVHERLVTLLADEKDKKQAQQIVLRIEQLLGKNADLELPGDTAWALRRLLEALARKKPMLVLIEDLQWAEPTLLEAIEHIAEYAIDTPIMLVGMGWSEELLRRNRYWPSGKLNALSIQLSPLNDAEAEQLLTHLLGGEPLHPDAQAQIAQKTQGNPLIIEELTDALMGDGVLRRVAGHWVLTQNLQQVSLPISIQALLEGRLERLDEEEREILGRAAVVGEQFHVGDLKVLMPAVSPKELSGRLDRLIRHELIRQDHDAAVPLPTESGEGYRFRHILIRDVAYERMSEELRAILHERYADWLELSSGERAGLFDELVAYHLNRTVDYLAVLPARGDRQRESARRRELARRAGMRFASAGRRAAVRGDVRPTTNWLERATRLLPDDDPARLKVLPDLAEALQASGRLEQAMKVYDEMISAASKAGAESRLKRAALGKLYVTAFRDLGSFLREGPDQIQRAIHVFERQQDQRGLAIAHYLLAYADYAMGRLVAAKPRVERAQHHARDASDRSWEAHILRLRCLILYWGPTPLREVVEEAEKAHEIARESGMRGLQAAALTIMARAAAMRDDFTEARRRSREANAITNNLGELLTKATDSISDGLIELLDGKLTAAEQALLNGYQALKGMGGNGPGASVAAMLARVYLEQRRNADAERMALECKATAADQQLDTQIKWRSISAIVLARRGDLAEAEPLAREALRRALQTDQLESLAEAHADLAGVLRLAERREEAAHELEQALDLYEEKGNRVMAKRVRRELVSVRL